MAKKDFFQTRTSGEIKKLQTDVVKNPGGLVDRIESLNPMSEGLILDFPLFHPDYNLNDDEIYTARRTMRGELRDRSGRGFPSYVGLEQPRSVKSAYAESRMPVEIRMEAFVKMADVPEEENNYVGFLRRPITGDRVPILTSFWAIMEGAKLDAYTGRVCENLPNPNAGACVERVYGPNVIVKVPSRTKGHNRYTIRWENIATSEAGKNARVLAWGSRPVFGSVTASGNFHESLNGIPTHLTYNVGHHKDGSSSREFTPLYPHGVAAHQTLLRYFLKEVRDRTPLRASQIPVPSRADAAFWNKLENNILVKYIGENGKESFRPLRIDQKSILMARRVGKYAATPGIPKAMYWDGIRDAHIANYPWLPGEE